MRVQVKRWGNSLAVRVPRPFAADAGVREGTKVDLTVSEGRLVATPMKKHRALLRQMRSRVTSRNRHAEIDCGPRVVREALEKVGRLLDLGQA